MASSIAKQVRSRKGVSSVLIPQNLLYPGLQLNIDRERASLIGLTPKQVVDNVITALTSNGMIEPSYWIDPKTGNNYMLTVQYFDKQIQNMSMGDFKQIPLRAPGINTPLQSVADIAPMNTPTEVDHYQLQRAIDIYVMPSGEALGGINREVNDIIRSPIVAGKHSGQCARVRGRHERIVQTLFHRSGAGRRARLPDSDGTVHVFPRPL